MTAPEPTRPTAEHIDAVARRMSTREWGEWSSAYHADFNRWTWDGNGRTDMERAEFRDYADAILTSTDPAVHAALLDALVRAGVLTEELGVLALRPDGEHWLAARFRTRGAAEAYCHHGAGLAVAHRHVTPWEVAP